MATSSNILAVQLQAKNTAKTLIAELAFPAPIDPVYKKEAIEVLQDIPPLRGALSFQSVKNDNPKLNNAAKGLFSTEFMDAVNQIDAQNLFCIVHGEFSRISGTDIEHSFPFTHIRERQIKFLKFLNSNKVFSDFFLKEEGMSELFKMDSDSEIKGTAYFYRMCFNNFSNLWLVCHACNIEKTDREILEWFISQKSFGSAFKKEVDNQGGLNSGVIFDKIGGKLIDELALDSKETLKIYHGGQGVGEFARKWYLSRHGDYYKNYREFYIGHLSEYRERLEAIDDLKNNKNGDEINKKVNELNRHNSRIKGLDGYVPSDRSESSEDSPTVLNALMECSQKDMHQQDAINHDIKHLKRVLTKSYPSRKNKIEALLSKIRQEGFEHEVNKKQVEDLRNEIDQGLESSSIPSWEDIKNKIKELTKGMNQKISEMNEKINAEIERSEAATRRAEIEAKNTEQERQKVESEKQNTEKEKQRADALEKEVEKLKSEKLLNRSLALPQSSMLEREKGLRNTASSTAMHAQASSETLTSTASALLSSVDTVEASSNTEDERPRKKSKR